MSELSTGAIPEELWPNLSNTEFDNEDLRRTTIALMQNGEVIPPEMIGVEGLILATQIRKHDFGDAKDANGQKIEALKEDPMWLGLETISILSETERDNKIPVISASAEITTSGGLIIVSASEGVDITSMIEMSLARTYDDEDEFVEGQSIFTPEESESIYKISKAAVEYADKEKVKALVLVDRAARLLWVGFKEYWALTHDKDERAPQIFFIEPDGFQDMYYLPKELAKEKLEKEHPFLSKLKEDKILVVDTCVHTGNHIGPVLDGLEGNGFKDVLFAVMNETDNFSGIKPDKVFANDTVRTCNHFVYCGYVTMHPLEGDESHLYAETRTVKVASRVNGVRAEVRQIVRKHFEQEQETPVYRKLARSIFKK
jgi:hypothetical protein